MKKFWKCPKCGCEEWKEDYNGITITYNNNFDIVESDTWGDVTGIACADCGIELEWNKSLSKLVIKNE